MDIEVVIDRERCIGSQNCVHHLPAMFQIDDEGLAVTIPHRDAPVDLLDVVVRDCPTEAIQLRRSATPE
ncbi:MAG TPA: ferredoxin [Acidimicrobiales bacterium]|nr:ferredoxin [Acidimicrobiales bacterium]